MKRSELVFNSKNDFIFFCKKRLGFQLFSHVISFSFGLNYKYDQFSQTESIYYFHFLKKIIIICNRELHRAKILWHCLLYITKQRIGISFSQRYCIWLFVLFHTDFCRFVIYFILSDFYLNKFLTFFFSVFFKQPKM